MNPKKKIDYSKPVDINKDAWFYPGKKSIEFVVWVSIDGNRKRAYFRIGHKKLLKYISSSN